MFQKVIIIGNLGQDPELRYTASGTAVCNLSIATNRKWTGSDGQSQEETVWFRVACWGKLGESVSKYLSKGRQVMVEGRLTPDENGNPRVWTDNNGTPRASFELTALDVRFLGSRGDDSGSNSITPGPPPDNIQEDEIPF